MEIAKKTQMPKTTKRKAARKITPGRRKDKTERGHLNELKATDLNAFNSAAEESFQNLICKLIALEGPQAVKEVYKEAAYELGVSVDTAKRYVEKHTARRAHFSFTEQGLLTCEHSIQAHTHA